MCLLPIPLSGYIQAPSEAHWLEICVTGQIETGRYWQLVIRPSSLTEQDAVAELRWRLAEAVRLRLMSDVPLGAFLSGGIDSSAVVAYMAQETAAPVRTFVVGFEESAFDERQFARMVAERYGTDHTELIVKAPVMDILPRLVWHYDEPFGDASAVPSYAIAALTHQYVTVVLNGDGGDENFAGYDRYFMHRLLCHGDKVPRQVWRTVVALTRRLPAGWHHNAFYKRLAKAAELLAQVPERRYVRWFGLCTPEERHHLYTAAFRATVGGSDPEALFVEVFGQSDAEEWTDAALAADVQLYLADDLLVKMDRATMAHSLEARSPFLDHTCGFVASSSTKLRGETKYP